MVGGVKQKTLCSNNRRRNEGRTRSSSSIATALRFLWDYKPTSPNPSQGESSFINLREQEFLLNRTWFLRVKEHTLTTADKIFPVKIEARNSYAS